MRDDTTPTAADKYTRDNLIEAVRLRIVDKPFEHRGRVWTSCEQKALAGLIGVDVKTVHRWTSKPPFVKAVIQLENNRRITLLRIGDPDAAPLEEAIARQMSSALNREFRACRKRDEQALAALDPTTPEARKLAKHLQGEVTRSTRRDWGNMCELARQWPPEIAAEAFEYAITHWSETMTSIKVEASAVGHDLTERRFYRYPMTAIMRKYPAAAFAPWQLERQIAASQKPASAANVLFT